MFQWEKKVFEYIDKDQIIFDKLKRYVQLVLDKNKEFNLTGFNEEIIWRDGIYQSIALLDKFIKLNSKKETLLLDIGSGAGFPSIPFFIFLKENIKLEIYEPIKKRATFLNLVKNELSLINLKVINKRIEDAIDSNERYNFITARAVMPLRMLIEISSKSGAIGCQYVFLKSKEVYQELNSSSWIINQLMIDDLEVHNVVLEDDKIHNIVVYSKKNKTPILFPRKWNEIKKEHNENNKFKKK